MVEGSVLFASLIQPVLLFPAGFAIDLAAIERIADSFAPPAILFLFAIIRHHGGLCDKDAPLPEVIKASSACANSDGIRFSVMARSMLVGVPQNACVSGQPVRRNSPVQPP